MNQSTDQPGVALLGEEYRLLPWLATLRAAGISYRAGPVGDQWLILVGQQDAALAMREICAVDAEGDLFQPEPLEDVAVPSGAMAVLVACSLLYTFALFGEAANHSEVARRAWNHGPSVLAGEWFRCVTALWLHADVAHLAGNLFGLAVFSRPICQRLGDGVGWLALVLAGALGNGANAALSLHFSIGASTMVFAAAGMLISLRREAPHRSSFVHTVAMLLAVLAILGSGPRSDLGAHFLGGVVGLLIGFQLARSKEAACGPVQDLAAGATGLLVLGAWWQWAL